MRVAYLVLTHNNPRLLRRTITSLSGRDSAFFVHIDRKSDIEAFSGIAAEDVSFSEERLPIHWGEFSIVEAELLLLRQALRASPPYSYFVLLSGGDYPLRSRGYIQSFLSANCGSEFISMVRMPAPGKPLSRINEMRFSSDQPVKRFAARGLAKLGLAQRDYRSSLGGLQPYAGDMWWALTQGAGVYLLDFIRRNQDIEKYFRNTCPADEMFFQTILGNSPFKPRIRRNLHYADWTAKGPHPAMITEEHVAWFAAREEVWMRDMYGSGEALFARKFSDSRLDLLDRIDEMIRRKDSRTPAAVQSVETGMEVIHSPASGFPGVA